MSLPQPLQPDTSYVLACHARSGLLGRAIQAIARPVRSDLPNLLVRQVRSYCHLAISYNGVVYEALAGGFTRGNLAERYAAWDGEVDAYLVEGVEPAGHRRIAERAEALAELHPDYDVRQLIAIGLERYVWGSKRLRLWPNDPDKLICSEAVAVIVRQAVRINLCGGYHLSVWSPSDIHASAEWGIVSLVGTIRWAAAAPGIESHAAAEL